MPIKDSPTNSNSLSAMFYSGLNFARTRSPAPSKKSSKSEAVPRKSRETPPIEIRRPSEDERVFRGIKSSLSVSPSSTASSMSTGSFRGRSVTTPSYLNSSTRSESASMGFGRQSRRRMGNIDGRRTLPSLRISRSSSSLSQPVPSLAPSKHPARSDRLVSFLDFDSDDSEEEGQELLISASVSSASSSQGALTPSDSGSLLSDSDGSIPGAARPSEDLEDALSKLDDDADHIIDAISLRLRLDEPETSDQFLHPRSGIFTELTHPHSPFAQSPTHSNYTLNGNQSEAPCVKTEYFSPSFPLTSSVSSCSSSSSYSTPPSHLPSSSPVAPTSPKGIDIALAEEGAGGIIPLTFSSLPIPFDSTRRPSEVSMASVSSAASDLTIDASTGVPRRKSSVYDSNFFEKIVSPTLDLFPSPPPSVSSTPASTPSRSSPLSRVDEENDDTFTPMKSTANTASIETLLGTPMSPVRSPSVRRPRTPPPPISAAPPPPPVPSLPIIGDSPSRVVLSAEAPARPRRFAPPAPLRFGVGTKFQPPTRNGALRRAPSILSPSADSEFPSPVFVPSFPPTKRGNGAVLLSSSMDEPVAEDFLEMYTPDFEMVMKVGGSEDINEELDSPGSFSPYPISPDTAEREDLMWSQVAQSIMATVEAEELRTSPSKLSPIVDGGETSPLPYAA